MADAASTQLVEHFFRHETGRLHGALIRLLGVNNFALAEDVAQEAMLRALRTWAMGGVPANPSAWITQVAMNLGRDALRRQRMAGGKEAAIITHLELGAPPAPSFARFWIHNGFVNVDSEKMSKCVLLFVFSRPPRNTHLPAPRRQVAGQLLHHPRRDGALRAARAAADAAGVSASWFMMNSSWLK